jgi:hypothetical protein
MVAVFHGPGIHVDVLRLLIAEFLDALIDILVGNLRIAIGHFDAAVVAQLDFRDHFELRLELQGLAIVEMDIFYIGRPDDVEVLGLELFLEELGDQVFQHLLPDIAGKLLADDTGRSFTRPEARKFGAFLDVDRNATQLAFHIDDRDGNFERVLATFY